MGLQNQKPAFKTHFCIVFLLSAGLFFSPATDAGDGHNHHDHHHEHDHGDENQTADDGSIFSSPTELEALRAELDHAIEEGVEHTAQGTNSNEELGRIGQLQIQLAGRLLLSEISQQEDLIELNSLSILSPPSAMLSGAIQVESASRYLGHMILHWNPISLGQRTIDIARRYGPIVGVGIAAGIGISECSEWMSVMLAAKLLPDAPLLAFLLAGYGGLHGGEVLGTLAVIKLPRKIADTFQWAHIMWKAGGPHTYQETIAGLRQEMPIDWSLKPLYFSSIINNTPQKFLVLDNHKLWDYFPKNWRSLAAMRAEIQKQSFPTLTLDQLRQALMQVGFALPPPSDPFQKQVNLSLAALQSSQFGRNALLQLLATARQKVRRDPNLAKPSDFSPAEALAMSLRLNRDGQNLNEVLSENDVSMPMYAERLRQGLLNQRAITEKFENSVRFWELNFQLFKKSWALNRMLDRLDAGRLGDEDLRKISLETRTFLRSFPEPEGILRGLVNAGDDVVQWRHELGFIEGDDVGMVNTKLRINQAVQRLSWVAYVLINRRLEKIRWATKTLGLSSSAFKSEKEIIRKLRDKISDLRVLGFALNAGAAIVPQANQYLWFKFIKLAKKHVLPLSVALLDDCKGALEAMPDATALSWELPADSHDHHDHDHHEGHDHDSHGHNH